MIAPNSNLYYYFYFISERMNIFWKRIDNQKSPWTTDPILAQHKFTNAYRFLDRESQYLISQIINPFQGKPEDLILCIIIYKIFNKSQTWEYLLTKLGTYPRVSTFDPVQIAAYLSQLQATQPIFNNAYMMTGSSSKYHLGTKHETRLTILQKEFIPLISKLITSTSLEEIYNNLRTITFFWPFIAMQYSIDLNYLPLWQFDENEFIIAWIGARRWIHKCFDDFDTYEWVLYWIYEHFDKLSQEFWLEPKLIPGRKLSMIDIQWWFCETDKYLRWVKPEVGKKMRIKQTYNPHSAQSIVAYEFPHRRTNSNQL